MIIDLILDRQDDDALIAAGYTHRRTVSGEIVPIAYDAARFYRAVVQYGEIGHAITAAMDYGTGAAVKRALCDYITANDYSPDICKYVQAVSWI